MDCIFCKIIHKEVKSDFLFENARVVAFKDIRPTAPVHILIVPKEHIQSIAHLEGNHKEIISELIFTAKALAQKAGLSGYKLVFNVGREGGQVIDHLHLHTLGGWTGKKDRAEMVRLGLDR